MGLQSFEDGLGRMVEGVFSRAFKSNVRPIEIGRRQRLEKVGHRHQPGVCACETHSPVNRATAAK